MRYATNVSPDPLNLAQHTTSSWRRIGLHSALLIVLAASGCIAAPSTGEISRHDSASCDSDATVDGHVADAGTVDPDPDGGTVDPDPDGGTVDPDGGTVDPDPDGGTVDPDAGAVDPDPDAGTVDPDAGVDASPPASYFSDEFGNTPIDLLDDNTTQWSVLHASRASAITVDNGRLSVVAQHSETVGANNGWFQDNYGPLLYQTVTGNFSVAVRLRVFEHGNPSSAPSGNFKAGGIVIRDPAGTHNNDENWVMYNMGQNLGAYQREIKKTTASASGLYLNAQVFDEQVLMVCRVNSRFYFFAWNETAQTWTAEHYQPGNTTNLVNAISEVDTSGLTPLYFNDGLPDEVQVGIMGHAWSFSGNQSQTEASYDWVRFRTDAPLTVADCTDVATP